MRKMLIAAAGLLALAFAGRAQAAMIQCDGASFEMITGMSMGGGAPAPLTAISRLDKDGRRVDTIFVDSPPEARESGLKLMKDIRLPKNFAFIGHNLAWQGDDGKREVYENCK